jgi:hypothetical protein
MNKRTLIVAVLLFSFLLSSCSAGEAFASGWDAGWDAARETWRYSKLNKAWNDFVEELADLDFRVVEPPTIVDVGNESAAPSQDDHQDTPAIAEVVEPVSSGNGFTSDMVAWNKLEHPVLFDADSSPAGQPAGSFDIGVNQGQVALVVGVNLTYGTHDIPGTECEFVVLFPGWYENFTIDDGRFTVYDVPSADYEGWIINDLVPGLVADQAEHHSCPTTDNHVEVWPEHGSAWIMWNDFISE